jgi:hypothetical protein
VRTRTKFWFTPGKNFLADITQGSVLYGLGTYGYELLSNPGSEWLPVACYEAQGENPTLQFGWVSNSAVQAAP